MSGGSYDYIYAQVESTCKGQMFDAEMNDLISDLCDVLHDVEWWQSGDVPESQYRETVRKFKNKWLHGDREVRLRGYIDERDGSCGLTEKRVYGVGKCKRWEHEVYNRHKVSQ